MEKYNGQLIRQFASNISGNAASGVTVTVRRQSDAGLATLYVSNNIAGATLPNPITTTATGHFAFYAADGVYTLTFSDNTPQQVVQLQDVSALQAQFDAAILAGGYIPSGTFAVGATLTQSNQILSDGSAYWRWDGALPKTVTAGSSPIPTGVGGWIVLSDQALRGDLAAANSTVLVGGVAASRLSQTVIQVAHIKALPVAGLVNNQQYSVASFYADSDKGGGVFVWDATRTKADHNGGTVIAPEALTAWGGTSSGIATLLNWAGAGTGCFVLDYKNDYVYAEWFGAIGYDTVEQADAGVDSTLQIYKAQQVAAVKLVDVYAVKDLQVTDKAVYMGNSSYLSRKYDSLKTDKPMLSAHSSCTTANKVIKCRDVKNWTVQGVNFDGRDRCPTIEGGAYRPTMIDVGIRGGLGNNLGDNLSPYTRGLHAVNITVREASVDNISCLVDSYINSAFISDAGRMNVNLLSGSGSNAFVGGKIEWCGQHGVNIYQSDNISFAGTIFDRCGYNAIRAVDSETITGNVILVRSGRNAQAQPAEYDSHLRVQGCKRVALLCVTRIYGDDGPNGGSGYISPRHTISSQNNESSCVLYGDLSGCTSKVYPEPEPSIDLSFCTGVKMEPNGKYKELLAGSSQTFVLKGFDLNNFDHFIADVTVSCTDETTAQNNAGSFKLFVKRLDGSASVVDITRYYATDGNRVGSTGTPVFLVSATVNSDASEITVTVASASANRNLVRVVSNMGTFNGF